MAQTTCPVCQSQQPDTSTLCEQCGWDFPIYLGSLEDAQKLGTRRLKEARAAWQETQERQQLRQSVQYLQEKLVLFEKQFQSQIRGHNERIVSLEKELKQTKSLNQKQLADAEQTRTQLENRITNLEQELIKAQQIIRKSKPYTKIGQGGVELPEDATPDQGWMMTRDERTGLIWEIKTGANKDEKYNWNNAQSVFIKKLNSERFGGFSDWRLPTKDELKSIVDKKNNDLAINTEYFPNTVASWYWSSTTYASNTDYAWIVNFYYGYDDGTNKTHNRYVRAVRGGQ